MKRVLVTGGGTGIGWAISRAFAAQGASVVIGQRSERKARAAAARLHARGDAAFGVGADLGSAEGCSHLVASAVEAVGGLDVVVNNAAISGPAALAPLTEVDDATLDRIIDVNLKAPFRIAREAVAHMGRGGVIVNISSVGGFAAQQHAAAYCASKGGLEMLTKSLAIDLVSRGIRVVGVAPGDIGTSRARAADHARLGLAGCTFVRTNPVGRRGRAEDVAAAVVFLASPSASFITGTTLVVDGGRLAYGG